MPETLAETSKPPAPVRSNPIASHLRLFFLQPVVALTLLLIATIGLTSFSLKQTLANPRQQKREESFVEGKDTGTYLAIARRFARGDFSMSWVRKRPHRVPLYPACLAVSLALAGENPVGFAVVNVVIACALITAVYLAVLALFGNRLVALLLGIAALANPFLLEFTTRRMMTEPLFVTIAIGAVYFFVTYARHHRPRDLLLMALCCSLAYLTRVNGLFLFLAMLGTLGAFDLYLLFLKSPSTEILRSLSRFILRYVLAALIALIVMAPNWWPRWHYFRDPIADGYPTNYLWVDTWEQGTTGKSTPSFGWKDYVSTHTFHDFVARWQLGIYRVCYTIPIRTEKIGLPYWLAIAGIVIALYRRKIEFILLTIVMIGVLMPAMWTFMPTRVPRIPYSSFLAFEFILTAFALDFGLRHFFKQSQPAEDAESPDAASFQAIQTKP